MPRQGRGVEVGITLSPTLLSATRCAKRVVAISAHPAAPSLMHEAECTVERHRADVRVAGAVRGPNGPADDSGELACSHHVSRGSRPASPALPHRVRGLSRLLESDDNSWEDLRKAMAYSQAVKERYFALRGEGLSISAAADRIGANRATTTQWETTLANGALTRGARQQAMMPGPKLRDDLGPEASRALTDFGYFRWRYLGRRSTPWQEESGYRTVEWLTSDDTEFIVVNCPPGTGKSTLFTNDIPLWMICRNRGIRIFLGHRVVTKAEQYAHRIRKTLERTKPLPAMPPERETAAEGCLAQDFGRFKPDAGELWRQGEFTVLSDYGDESAIEDKEPTVMSEGMGSEFLGVRAELVVWDDLVTNAVMRNSELIEQQRVWWDTEGVTRVEPGGCLLLVGQRMGAEDLYRHCLNEKLGEGEDENGDPVETEESRYKHIIYPAHYEDRCTGKHGRTPEFAYPQGCLLDPVRRPWSGTNGLSTIMRNREATYRVQFQQEDSDPASVLVKPIWITGGKDTDGVEHPGCWDKDRGLCEWPSGLTLPYYSIATADPSPTKFWAIEWWLYHPASKQRFLLDLVRQSLEAPDFLDWNANNSKHYGIAEDWQQRSVELGLPITHWIIENNAAQRFLLQYDHVKRWQRKWHVGIIPHSTTVRKLDETYGLEMLRDLYKFGNVRLPGKQSSRGDRGQQSRNAANKLIWEVTHHDKFGNGGGTDDCMMAQWFLEVHLPGLSRDVKKMKKSYVPTFLSR